MVSASSLNLSPSPEQLPIALARLGRASNASFALSRVSSISPRSSPTTSSTRSSTFCSALSSSFLSSSSASFSARSLKDSFGFVGSTSFFLAVTSISSNSSALIFSYYTNAIDVVPMI